MVKNEPHPDEMIRKNLSALRQLRFFCHFPFLTMFLLVPGSQLLSPVTREYLSGVYALVFLWAVFGFFLSFRIRFYPCPRCGKKFHAREDSEGKFSWLAYNDFARQCMNCGLQLNGRNVDV